MAINITLQRSGLNARTVKLTRWKKKEAEKVQEEEVLIIAATRKVAYEVQSPGKGILHIIVNEGAEVSVEEVVGIIAADETEYDKIRA